MTFSESSLASSRHLLRGILRECTYLPDSFARRWANQYALSRFRNYSVSDYGFQTWQKRRRPEDVQERLRKKEEEAQNELLALKRANDGERKVLKRVLEMAYGRIRKRRRELLQPLLPKPMDEDMKQALEKPDTLDGKNGDGGAATPGGDGGSSASSGQSFEAPPKPKPSTRGIELTPQFRALLVSQMKDAPPTQTRRILRRLTPDIPELNSWLRPMPLKRVKNMERKHYALLLDRAQPPLPDQEWERLLELAAGRSKIEIPVRRSSASRLHEKFGNAFESVVMNGKVPKTGFTNHNVHAITPRMMRRLYVLIFSECPRIDWVKERQDWSITWGHQALPRSKMLHVREVEHAGT